MQNLQGDVPVRTEYDRGMTHGIYMGGAFILLLDLLFQHIGCACAVPF